MPAYSLNDWSEGTTCTRSPLCNVSEPIAARNQQLAGKQKMADLIPYPKIVVVHVESNSHASLFESQWWVFAYQSRLDQSLFLKPHPLKKPPPLWSPWLLQCPVERHKEVMKSQSLTIIKKSRKTICSWKLKPIHDIYNQSFNLTSRRSWATACIIIGASAKCAAWQCV